MYFSNNSVILELFFRRDLIMALNEWDYDSLIQEIHWQELKLKRINNTKEYLNIIRPPFYRINERKKWNNRFNALLNEEKEVLDLLFILYTTLQKLL